MIPFLDQFCYLLTAATMKDADFLHEAAQLELEVRPVTGIEVQALINVVYASPAPIVKRASVYGGSRRATSWTMSRMVASSSDLLT